MKFIYLDLEEKNELGTQWDAANIIRTNFGHGRRIVCLLHRVAEGIWPCKLDQINADPKGIWYRLVGTKEHSSANCTWVRILKCDLTKGRKEA
jgi:hypothetical protein